MWLNIVSQWCLSGSPMYWCHCTSFSWHCQILCDFMRTKLAVPRKTRRRSSGESLKYIKIKFCLVSVGSKDHRGCGYDSSICHSCQDPTPPSNHPLPAPLSAPILLQPFSVVPHVLQSGLWELQVSVQNPWPFA